MNKPVSSDISAQEQERIHSLLLRVFDIINIESILNTEIHRSNDTLCFKKKEFSLSIDTKIRIVAIGKAAIPMANFFSRLLSQQIRDGIIISHITAAMAQELIISPFMQYYQSSHPIPSQLSINSAHALIDFVQSTPSNTLILFCISGGGSALVELPVSSVKLSELSDFYTFLIGSGLSIEEMNALRIIISQIKGGKLLSFVPNDVKSLSFIVSDVEKNPKMFVSSGLTAVHNSYDKHAKSAILELKRRDILKYVTPWIKHLLKHYLTHPLYVWSEKNRKQHQNFVIADAKYIISQVKQTAKDQGFLVRSTGNILKQSSEVLVSYYQKKILSYHRNKKKNPFLFIASAEPSIIITSNKTGKGGRNQHLALALLLALGINPPPFIFVSLATDGKDGNSDSAGAIIDHNTYKKAVEKKIDLLTALQNFSSHQALKQLGCTIDIGATMSNFMDLHFLYLFCL